VRQAYRRDVVSGRTVLIRLNMGPAKGRKATGLGLLSGLLVFGLRLRTL
jgi:hypothetical protein